MTNGTAIQARYLGGALGSLANTLRTPADLRIANAKAFGDDTSWPQGMQSVLTAMVPPIIENSPQAAAEIRFVWTQTATANGLAQGDATLAADWSLTAAVNNLLSGSASLTFSMDLTATARGFAQGAATLDWVSRPTAGDISQEIWNSFAIEGGLSGAEVMRVLLAVAAGKTDIVGSGPTVVTFRDQADTKNRVRASMTGSERDSVTVDGA